MYTIIYTINVYLKTLKIKKINNMLNAFIIWRVLNMKKLSAILLVLLMAFSFVACSTSQETEQPAEQTSEQTTEETSEETQTFTVGIFQQLQHNALDAAATGFQNKLTELAQQEGIEIVFDLQNAS